MTNRKTLTHSIRSTGEQLLERFKRPETPLRVWMIHTVCIGFFGSLALLVTLLSLVGLIGPAYLGLSTAGISIAGTVYFEYGSPQRDQCRWYISGGFLLAGLGIAMTAIDGLAAPREVFPPFTLWVQTVGYIILDALILAFWYYISMYELDDVADVFVLTFPEKWLPEDPDPPEQFRPHD